MAGNKAGQGGKGGRGVLEDVPIAGSTLLERQFEILKEMEL